MVKLAGLKREFNEEEKADFLKAMKAHGFSIIENSQPDFRKPNTSGFLKNKEDQHSSKQKT